MADIQIENKCSGCGKEIAEGEKVVVVATGTMTSGRTFRARPVRQGKLRINFVGGPKVVYHTTCYRW